MHPNERALIDAWLVASADLGIDITTPFSVELRGRAASFLLLVHGFGSPKGTVVCTTTDDLPDAFDIAEEAGYYSSALNPEAYARYDRQHFVDTLADWGWFGTAPAPAWYTGQRPWG